MMSEFSRDLAGIHNRMVNGQYLQSDSDTLAKVPRQQLDSNDFKLINQMLALVQSQNISKTRPSLGAQQIVASKKDSEKEFKKVLERLLVDRKHPPKRGIEPNYKPKTR